MFKTLEKWVNFLEFPGAKFCRRHAWKSKIFHRLFKLAAVGLILEPLDSHIQCLTLKKYSSVALRQMMFSPARKEIDRSG